MEKEPPLPPSEGEPLSCHVGLEGPHDRAGALGTEDGAACACARAPACACCACAPAGRVGPSGPSVPVLERRPRLPRGDSSEASAAGRLGGRRGSPLSGRAVAGAP